MWYVIVIPDELKEQFEQWFKVHHAMEIIRMHINDYVDLCDEP